MLGIFSNKPLIKVNKDEVEIRLFDPKKDNWKEVRNMAFTPFTETTPKILKDLLFHPILSSVIAILAGVLYQMKGSLWNPFIFVVGIYPTLYFFLLWRIPESEMSKQVDYNKFVEYWTDFTHPLWLLFHKGGLIGSVGLKELDVDTRGELVRLAIATDYRRNGLAKMLVNTVIEYCEKYKYNDLILATSAYQTEAMKLYEKSGFTLYEKTKVYFIKPIFGVDVNCYRIKFPRK
ncbi:unnamed protein product [Owenia fusiformis]|uniref:N-acetyltransferase domain-containing protein n=1 Tax=Owenia fusiformis TaxID=6347 RepID=A0A8S4P3G4_OWEFU|nr:unnamed protein product [Owenia fusiformis]